MVRRVELPVASRILKLPVLVLVISQRRPVEAVVLFNVRASEFVWTPPALVPEIDRRFSGFVVPIPTEPFIIIPVCALVVGQSYPTANPELVENAPQPFVLIYPAWLPSVLVV